MTPSETCTTNNPATSGAIQVTIYPLPVVEINVSPNDTVCITEIVFLDAGNSGVIFEWSTGETTQQIEFVNESGPGRGLQSYWVNGFI